MPTSHATPKYLLPLVCFAATCVAAGITWVQGGGTETIFVVTVSLLLSSMAVLLRSWKRHLVSLLFFFSFFIFLCGREILEIIFTLRRNDYSAAVTTHTYIELFVSVSTMLATYACISFLRGSSLPSSSLRICPLASLRSRLDVQAYRRHARQASVLTYVIVLFAGMAIRIIAFRFVQVHGYKALYIDFAQQKNSSASLLLLEKLEFALPLALAICLCLALSTTTKSWIIGSFACYLALSLGSGQRAQAFSGGVVVLIYLLSRAPHRLPSHRRWGLRHHAFHALAAVMTAAGAIMVATAVETMRGTRQSAFTSPLLSFFYQQGVSINVLKKEILYSTSLPDNTYYSLSAFSYGIFAKLRGITVYHGNTPDNALHGSSLSHALTYVSDPPLYLNGGGIGSSFIAEAHHDFGLAGVACFSVLIAALLVWLDRIGTGAWTDVLRLITFPSIIWAPRGEATGFITKLVQPSYLLLLTLIACCFFFLRCISRWRPRIPSLARDVFYSITANIISMAVMGALTLVLPKFLSLTHFSLWQLYIMWAMYGGYLTLGLSDGVYLRYGGCHVDALPARLISAQLRVLVLFHLIFTTVGTAVTLVICDNTDYIYISLCVFLSSALYVPRTFLTSVMQTSGSIRDYSIAVILERGLYGLAILAILAVNISSFHAIVYADLAAKGIALLYSLWRSRPFLSSFSPGWRVGAVETLASIKVGLQILFANLASLLINGIVRIVIQLRWGLVAFGYVSLAFTLANVIISFIQAVALAFFPHLKRMNDAHHKYIYLISSGLLNTILFGCLTLYFPLSYAVNVWLPDYNFSAAALALLFPMTLFEARYRMLHNTFLKALRHETYILANNLVALVIAAILSYLCAYWINSIQWTIATITLSLGVRGLFADLRLCYYLRVTTLRDIVMVPVMCTAFLVCTQMLSHLWALGTYSLLFAAYTSLEWPDLTHYRASLSVRLGAERTHA